MNLMYVQIYVAGEIYIHFHTHKTQLYHPQHSIKVHIINHKKSGLVYPIRDFKKLELLEFKFPSLLIFG